MEKKVLDLTYEEARNVYFALECTKIKCTECALGFGANYCLFDYAIDGKTLRESILEIIKEKEDITVEV